MVWKNFKKQPKQVNYASRQQVEAFRKDRSTNDGVMRPSDTREKLTFIEQVHIKNARKNRKVRDAKAGSEVLLTSAGLRTRRAYKDYMSRTISLLRSEPFLAHHAKHYLQQSRQGVEAQLGKAFGEKNLSLKPFGISFHFRRHFRFRTLLFRSFWMDKFVNTLVRDGRRSHVWGYVFKVLCSLKQAHMRAPLLLLFEILEMYKAPLKALPPKNKTRKVIVRVHLVAWWKQYTQVLRWIRQTVRAPHRTRSGWGARVFAELDSLLRNDRAGAIQKKIELNNQLVAFGRVSIHFRWFKRYRRRRINLKM